MLAFPNFSSKSSKLPLARMVGNPAVQRPDQSVLVCLNHCSISTRNRMLRISSKRAQPELLIREAVAANVIEGYLSRRRTDRVSDQLRSRLVPEVPTQVPQVGLHQFAHSLLHQAAPSLEQTAGSVDTTVHKIRPKRAAV